MEAVSLIQKMTRYSILKRGSANIQNSSFILGKRYGTTKFMNVFANLGEWMLTEVLIIRKQMNLYLQTSLSCWQAGTPGGCKRRQIYIMKDMRIMSSYHQ